MSKPTQRLALALAEIDPHTPTEDLSVHCKTSITNGTVSNDDVVLYMDGDVARVGQLRISFSPPMRDAMSVVTTWERAVVASEVPGYRTFNVRSDGFLIQTSLIRTALTCRFSESRDECTVYLPIEYRG